MSTTPLTTGPKTMHTRHEGVDSMKKVFTYFLVIALAIGTLLTAVGCGGGGGTTANKATGDITGVVRWLDPTPAGSIGLIGAVVSVWDAQDNKVASGITDDLGKFSIDKIPVGTYTVSVYMPKAADGTQNVEQRWLKSGVAVKKDLETALEFVYQNAIGAQLPEKYLK
jgi:hypothetical protein